MYLYNNVDNVDKIINLFKNINFDILGLQNKKIEFDRAYYKCPLEYEDIKNIQNKTIEEIKNYKIDNSKQYSSEYNFLINKG